jgi:superfamily I DNA/RNA helicase
MSRNAFAECEREYNEREQQIEVARDERARNIDRRVVEQLQREALADALRMERDPLDPLSSAADNIAAVRAEGKTPVVTVHAAKGLEFRAVAVMACDDEVLPLQERVEAVTDEADLLEVHETERHLLYVACTRARDSLWVSWTCRVFMPLRLLV